MPDVSPRLPMTSDTSDYAPYSFLAILSLSVAVLFAVLLIIFGFGALRQGQSVILPELLIIPLIALVLSFAARKQIANSEGTRVGLQFVNYAWWIAIVGGGSYLVYLFGVYFAIRRDADTAFRTWSDTVVKANPLEAKNVDLLRAFHGTLPPEKQGGMAFTDYAKIQSLAGPGLMAFRQSDIVRVAYRNKGDLKFEIGGLEEWTQKGPRLECRLTVKATCAEGEYGLSVPMARLNEAGKSESVWQIVPNGSQNNEGTSFLRTGKLNAYGDRIRDMEVAAAQFVYQYFLGTASLRGFNSRLFDEFGQTTSNGGKVVERLQKESEARMAAFGGLAWGLPDPADGYDATMKKYFQPTDKGDPVREDEQRKAFARVWKSGTIGSPGFVLAKSPDQSSILVPVATGWEIRVPVEMTTANSQDRSPSAARGVVVLMCDDKEFLIELDKLKNTPSPLNDARPLLAPKIPVPWRLSRIESDMKMQLPPRQGPGPD
ncbi:hypothetical protein BH11PLA2_BH11PLA2_19220 [soil metagenome]